MQKPFDTTAVFNQVNQPIALARGLPNACYTTDTAFVQDRDSVISENWACIGFIDQLPEPNYVTPINFMGLPLLLTRDKEDTYRVFHNVCSHRGMELADKPCKNSGSIRCPYHSWTYALNGELRGTPNIGGYGIHAHEDFDPTDHGLKQVRSAIWLGAVFVNLSGEAIPFEEYIAPITDSWSEFLPVADLEQYTVATDGSKMSLTVQSNWKLAVENYLESYHLPTVHPELNRVSPLAEHYCVDSFENGAGQGSYNYTRLEINQQSLPSQANWKPACTRTAEYPVLFPNTFFGVHTDHLFIMYLQPLSNTATTEHVRILYVGDEAQSATYALHRETTLTNWENVFREDIFAVERMQKGRLSPGFTGGVFSPEMDGPTLHFHRWVAQAMHKLS
ncbi:MAG: aromatic ring-hydroxylating dioxygenase subunit alpha [Granulosicoccus sp.]|nr:aromatic ring-hydroxylating dioxygenase subunit alpha [Granulosicoccus sp.]